MHLLGKTVSPGRILFAVTGSVTAEEYGTVK